MMVGYWIFSVSRACAYKTTTVPNVQQTRSQLWTQRARQLRAAILIGQERFDEGASALRDLLEDDSWRAQSVAVLVQTYLRNGGLEAAFEFLTELIAANPENVQALGLRGNLHFARREFDEAEQHYRSVLQIDAENVGAFSALSRLAAARGNSREAEDEAEAGLEVAPNNLLLLAHLAQMREARGDFDSAIELYKRLYEIVPTSLVVANNLSSLLSDHRADDPAEVDRAYRIAERLRDSDIPQYRDTYGWTRFLKGEYQDALEHIEPLIEALPNNPWINYHLGMIYLALHESGNARMHLEAALDQSAGRPFPPTEQIKGAFAKLDQH